MLFLRRRSKASAEPELEPGTKVQEMQLDRKSCDTVPLTAAPAAQPVSKKTTLTMSDLDRFLALPTPDKDLMGELRSLGHLLQQHVEDHYHLSAATQSADSLRQALSDLQLPGAGKSVPGEERLVELAMEPETRHMALRHIIARVIFDSISVQSTGKISLLPASVSLLTQSMPPVEKHVGNPAGEHRTSTTRSVGEL